MARVTVSGITMTVPEKEVDKYLQAGWTVLSKAATKESEEEEAKVTKAKEKESEARVAKAKEDATKVAEAEARMAETNAAAEAKLRKK